MPKDEGRKNVTDWLWELYSVFLNTDYAPYLFWELSLDEILDMLESYDRRKKAEFRRKAEFNMVQAMQTAEFISVLFQTDKSKIKVTPLSEYFPKLFPRNQETTGENDNQMSRELAVNKAKMEEFAFWHNRKLQSKGR